jgi:hypothetical protein
MPELRSVDLSNTGLNNTTTTVSTLTTLVTKNPQIKELDLSGNTILAADVKAIQDAWGYRGLKLPQAA